MVKRILLICAALGLLAGCNMDMNKALDAGSDAYKAASLSDAEVQQMGKEVAQQYDAQNKVAASTSAYVKRLNKITKGLTTEDGLKLNFKVYLTSDVNAFALPDGSIRVYSGLLDLMKNDDEVFFVIGHEIGHVKLGHTANRFKMAYATSAARKGAAAAGGAAAALSQSQLGEIGEAFIHAQFSQKQESNSDEYGLAMMKKYKKDTAKAVSALRALASLGGGGGLMASHPDANKRADNIEAQRNKK